MACACGAGMPGQGVDPGVCVDSTCPFTTGGHCGCVHLPSCPECNRSGWHAAHCSQPDDDPGPQCPSTSHGTDGGWRCEHRAGHDGGHRNRGVEW